VPYINKSTDQKLFRWYDEGLNAFRCNSSSAQRVADILHAELLDVLNATDTSGLDAFVEKTRSLSVELEQQMHNGRDQLLELNSCRKELAEDLIDLLNAFEKEGALWPYMEDLFECYGVDTEFHSPDCFIVRPGDHLRISHFPGLNEDGLTVTGNRQIALEREEFQFITWEHPLVTASMDLVLSSETGNAAISVVKHEQLRGGQFLLECLFVVECSAPAELQIGRFLPHTPIRVLIDQNKKDQTEAIEHRDLIEPGIKFDKQKITAFLGNQRLHLANMLVIAEQKAKNDMDDLVANATARMLESLSAEIKRLVRLQKVNPSIKTEEIEQLKDVAMLAHENIQSAQLRLDAVRFIITS